MEISRSNFVGLLLFLLLGFTLGDEPEEVPESVEGVLFTEAPFHLENPPPQKINSSSNSSEFPSVIASAPLEPEVVANVTNSTPEVLLFVSSSTSTTNLPITTTTPTIVETPAKVSISLYPDYPNVPPSLFSHISTMIKSAELLKIRREAEAKEEEEKKKEEEERIFNSTSTTPRPLPPIPHIKAIISELEKAKKEGAFNVHPKLHLIPAGKEAQEKGASGVKDSSRSLWDLIGWGSSKEKVKEEPQGPVEYKEKTILKPADHPVGGFYYECPFKAVTNSVKKSGFF